MAKRFIYPQQYGERKKAKLDISVSDHNFPLSQNPSSSKDADQSNNWGDDNDDEILLLASQVCEEAIKDHNISILPNYSMCMQPSSTSTQISEPNPSSPQFCFKKPVSNTINMISTKLRDKCERISSPLPGLSKAFKSSDFNLNDDVIINDKNKDCNLYQHLLELQEENKKIKSENGELLEKYVTKEGEASILRTQLKTCQASVDNVRLEKIKAQEKAQMEWSDKLTAANNKLQDLRTQLDIKNLEVISMKEKCKMLESQKVKLTQVMLPTSDISMSQRHNNTLHKKSVKNDSKSFLKKPRTACSSAQTENKSHFLKLTIPQRLETSKLTEILPYMMSPTEDHYSILDYNDKLKQQMNIQNKFRIFSTFHRFPMATGTSKVIKKNINLKCIYEDISYIAICTEKDICIDRYLNIFKIVKQLINEIQAELEIVSQRMTTAFQKQMDEKYIDVTSKTLVVDKRDLLCGRVLFKEEQAILARRMTAILCYILEYSPKEDIISHLLETEGDRETHSFVNTIHRICQLLDSTTTAILYSGFLLSITYLIQVIHQHTDKRTILNIVKIIIFSRPMLFVSSHIVELILYLNFDDIKKFCLTSANGNLKVDHDQGVLLFKKDSCPLQIVLRQIEAELKCIEREQLQQQAVDITRYIILLYGRLKLPTHNSDSEEKSCSCHLTLTQVLVYGLKICSMFLIPKPCEEVLSICTSGLQILQQSNHLLQLGTAEGHLLCFCNRLCDGIEPPTTESSTGDIHRNMLSEITSTLQSVEEQPQSYLSKAWLGALNTLSIAD